MVRPLNINPKKSEYSAITAAQTSHSSSLRFALISFFLLTLGLAFSSCRDNDDLWDEIPPQIASFINEYYPNSVLGTYYHSGGTYHIRIENGPGMTFDSQYQWTELNGYGLPLPEVFLFDNLPSKLYDYLEGTNQLNAVFSARRGNSSYTVSLLNQEITYDIASARISGSTPRTTITTE